MHVVNSVLCYQQDLHKDALSKSPLLFPAPQSLRELSLNEVDFIQQGRHIAQHGRGAHDSNAAIRNSIVGSPAPDTDRKR